MLRPTGTMNLISTGTGTRYLPSVQTELCVVQYNIHCIEIIFIKRNFCGPDKHWSFSFYYPFHKVFFILGYRYLYRWIFLKKMLIVHLPVPLILRILLYCIFYILMYCNYVFFGLVIFDMLTAMIIYYKQQHSTQTQLLKEQLSSVCVFLPFGRW